MPETPASLPDRVLVVRLGALGDVVNALVLARVLKRARPDVHLGWATHDLAEPLLRRNPCVDRVHLWRRASGWRGFAEVSAEIEAVEYGLVLELQRIAKSALLARAARAPRVLGFDRARSKEGAWLLASERLAPRDPGAPMVEQYLEFASALGLDARYAGHPLPEDAQAAAWAASRVEELGAAPILIHVGASKPSKRWPEPRMGALARELALRGRAPVVLTGAPSERAIHAPSLHDAREVRGVLDFVGRTTVLQLLELQRRARLVIACDTGPMHLAAAVACPVLALFGAVPPRRTGPWSPEAGRHRVLRAPSHSMADLSVEEVLAAACAMLMP